MLIKRGVISITLKYCYLRSGVYYFQRPVPRDLQDRYGKKLVKTNLRTSDTATAARAIERMNRQLEEDWAMLRASPNSSLKATKKHAEAFLASWGITPSGELDEAAEAALSLLYDHLDKKREAHADGDEEVYRSASGTEFLTPVEAAAIQMVTGTLKPALSDMLDLYLETHQKRGDAKFETYAKRAFGGLLAAIGDKPIDEVTREDARKYIAKQLEKGNKTTTVRRRLNTFKAAMTIYIREKELNRANPFEAIKIAAEGSDAEDREPFTPEELATLEKKCRSQDDDMRWLLAMLADTGARLAEVAGLTLGEINLKADVPHIVIQRQPWRDLKTDWSVREVPLMGMALWGAKRVVESAKPGQRFAFPRYTSEQKGCNAESASAGVAKWLRTNGLDHTAHELRHTMADRLREVHCPEEVRHSIGGWATRGEAARYGKGYSLLVKREWLSKVCR
ncbi:phage integrase [Cupriavidus sp. H39]|uniref:phage integrase n=1 Tax=Cupriavidus sp. H39 TaxID=3401635 RepID=UPI003CFEE933